MAKTATDLSTAAGLTDPSRFTDLKSSGQVPDDFEIDGVAGLQDNTGGQPYEPGESFLVEMTFNGQKSGHAGNLDNVLANYSFNASTNITVKDNSLLPVVEWEVDSSAPDGTETIGETYDEPFNSGATDVGVEQTLDVSIEGYNVDVSASPDSSSEITVTYDITNGDPDYSVEIYRKQSSDSSYPSTPEHTETQTSEGQYTWQDSGLQSATSYDYKVEVTDNSGTLVSDTASATTL